MVCSWIHWRTNGHTQASALWHPRRPQKRGPLEGCLPEGLPVVLWLPQKTSNAHGKCPTHVVHELEPQSHCNRCPQAKLKERQWQGHIAQVLQWPSASCVGPNHLAIPANLQAKYQNPWQWFPEQWTLDPGPWTVAQAKKLHQYKITDRWTVECTGAEGIILHGCCKTEESGWCKTALRA